MAFIHQFVRHEGRFPSQLTRLVKAPRTSPGLFDFKLEEEHVRFPVTWVQRQSEWKGKACLGVRARLRKGGRAGGSESVKRGNRKERRDRECYVVTVGIY